MDDNMLRVVDKIKYCDDGDHRCRPIDSIEGITIHHFGDQLGTDMVDIASFYRKHPEWTGGQMPYTLGVLMNGVVEQALPLREIGPHALRWSSSTISVVFFGTFDEEPPPAHQWDRGVSLVGELCVAFGFSPLAKDANGICLVEGHTARPGSTKYPDKACPGKAFNMDRFRSDVARMIREGAIQRLTWAGVQA